MIKKIKKLLKNIFKTDYSNALHADETDAIIASMAGNYEDASNVDDYLSADEKRVLSKAIKYGALNRGRDGSVKHTGQIGTADTITSLITSSKGDLNITVTRGDVIHGPGVVLPYVLFGLQGVSTNFSSAIKPYLPAGISLTSATRTSGNMVLTFSNSDTVTISMSGLISYGEFLESMNANYFTCKYIRYEVAEDANRMAQQREQISFGTLSALGKQTANQLMPRSRVMSGDFNKGITNLLFPEQKIVSDFSFVQGIIPVASYSIAWDVFMASRLNLNEKV